MINWPPFLFHNKPFINGTVLQKSGQLTLLLMGRKEYEISNL